MISEKNLTRTIQLMCGKKGWQCHDVNVGGGELVRGGYFRSGLPKGFPDLLILTNDGRTIFIEAKVGNNQPSNDQINFIKVLRKNGHFADIVWNVNDFKALIDNDFTKFNCTRL